MENKDKLEVHFVKTLPNSRIQIKIKQGEQRVVRAPSSWAITLNEVSLNLDKSELDTLIGMLQVYKSKFKQGN